MERIPQRPVGGGGVSLVVVARGGGEVYRSSR